MMQNKKKYNAFSLVEMLLTIAIIGFVVLISSVTLTTLIKVSTVASNKIRARNESEFVLELVRRTVRNSNPSDIYIFNSSEERKYDSQNDTFVDEVNVEEAYSVALGENIFGNEIHFRPYGYRDWICIGFFGSSEEDSELGYILMTSARDVLRDHSTCFSDSNYLILLNSEYVNVNSFDIAYTLSGDSSYLVRFNIESEPVDWYLGAGAPINRKVIRQGVVSTEGLIW